MSRPPEGPATGGEQRDEAGAGRGSGPLRLFYSYAHEDSEILEGLRAHLAPLRKDLVVEDWFDRRIRAGRDWQREIAQHLRSADLAIILLSADFIASDYAYGRELGQAMKWARDGIMSVVPVLARPCLWENLEVAQHQALPANGVPISLWDDRDVGLLAVVRGIADLARERVAGSRDLADEWIEHRLMRHRIILQVQEQLARLGYAPGPVDGLPGPETERAVAAFQKDAGIEVDARIGPTTIRRLAQAMSTLAQDAVD